METTTKGAAPVAPAVVSFFFILHLLASFSTANGQRGPPIVIPSPSVTCPPVVINAINSVSLPFQVSSPNCTQPWPLGLIFLFEQSSKSKNLWSFVLAGEDVGGYIAVGSSPDGSMIGSSAIAGWIPSSGKGVVKSYYLGGYNSTAVVPDRGNLTLVPGSASIVSRGGNLFLGFQLTLAGKPSPNVILAVGPPKRLPGPDFLLPVHYARTSALISS